MKLWVDDLRPRPDESWGLVKTSKEALAVLKEFPGFVSEISLDHDLGGNDTTRSIVRWMAANDEWPDIVRVHTQNPVGREWLEGMIERYGPGVTR